VPWGNIRGPRNREPIRSVIIGDVAVVGGQRLHRPHVVKADRDRAAAWREQDRPKRAPNPKGLVRDSPAMLFFESGPPDDTGETSIAPTPSCLNQANGFTFRPPLPARRRRSISDAGGRIRPTRDFHASHEPVRGTPNSRLWTSARWRAAMQLLSRMVN
jgi:hypothetical protein